MSGNGIQRSGSETGVGRERSEGRLPNRTSSSALVQEDSEAQPAAPNNWPWGEFGLGGV